MILDASVVVAALVERNRTGGWARELVGAGQLMAPHLLPAEVCHVLRRQVARGVTSLTAAHDAVSSLIELAVELHSFEPHALRAWELRDTLSAYDAWYVALAEALESPMATLDARLARAPGPRCRFVVPEFGGSPSVVSP